MVASFMSTKRPIANLLFLSAEGAINPAKIREKRKEKRASFLFFSFSQNLSGADTACQQIDDF